jgi:hypothetical protein
MKRLNIFAKGNVDVHDPLLYSRVSGKIEWNGINTLLAERHPGYVARIRHEVCVRWNFSGLDGRVPEELQRRNLPLGAFTLDAQYRSQLLEVPSDVVVLSIEPDVANSLYQHRRDGYFFFPAERGTWSDEDRQWCVDEFVDVGPVSPAESMKSLATIVEAIRLRTRAKILVLNMSSVVPGERIHSHRGLERALSTRARAFNLALCEFSQTSDISVVDVDHVVARAGADRLKVDYSHYRKAGCRLIAAEILRVLEEIGTFDE